MENLKTNTNGSEADLEKARNCIVTDPVLERQFSSDTGVHYSPEGQISHYATCDEE